MADPIPGKVYEVTGENRSLSQSPPRGGDYSGEAMFVRKERIEGEEWYCFVTTDSEKSLFRVRVPCGGTEIGERDVSSRMVLETYLFLDRTDPPRRPSVNAFIDEAKRIADETPSLEEEIPGLREAIARKAKF